MADPWTTEEPELKRIRESIVQGFETDVMPHLNRKKFRRGGHLAASKKHLLNENLTVSHPGTSVNPLPSHHQDVLRKAYDIEMSEIAEAKRLRLVLNPPPLPEALARAPPERDDESEIVARKKPKTLTKADRNKQKRNKAKAQELARQKEDEKAMKQFSRVDVIEKEVLKEEKKLKGKRETVAHLKATAPDRRAVLGKHRFEEAFPVVPLTDDIKGGNLRQMKPSIHVVRDQFQRFQSKNVIETTKRQKRGGHRGNYKYFLRPGCKMQTLEEANEHSRENSKHSKYTKTKLLAKQ